MMKELECKCETCNIELFSYVMLPFGRDDHNMLSRRSFRKFGKHMAAGHDVTNEIYSVFCDSGYQVKVHENDTVTYQILDSDEIIIP